MTLPRTVRMMVAVSVPTFSSEGTRSGFLCTTKVFRHHAVVGPMLGRRPMLGVVVLAVYRV